VLFLRPDRDHVLLVDVGLVLSLLLRLNSGRQFRDNGMTVVTLRRAEDVLLHITRKICFPIQHIALYQRA
jgi:hypothetical protein